MCLLVAVFKENSDAPLYMGANRDEWLDRPAAPFGILASQEPRVLGGKDELAGGTWLVVNEWGVVAALTNQPTKTGADPAKKSRGELPLVLSRYPTAREAVEAFQKEVSPDHYNPCWILVGDRNSLHYLALEGGGFACVRELGPGVHVLENRALDAPSPKASHVASALVGVQALAGDSVVGQLSEVLSSHEIPESSVGDDLEGSSFHRPPQMEASCVHAGPYGTRSSVVVVLPSNPSQTPEVYSADGPLCQNNLVDVSDLWIRKSF